MPALVETTPPPPLVLLDGVELTVPDPGRAFESVVLGQEVARPRPGPPFVWQHGAWRLHFDRPDVDRLEYLLGIDGGFTPDPGNPLRAPGPFGDKSVIEWPEYAPPAWLESDARAGLLERLEIPSGRLRGAVRVLLYRSADRPALDAPLLVVHDGPEYAEYARLVRYLDTAAASGRTQPLSAALLQPADRNEIYSASALYADALVHEVLPALSRRIAHGPRVGMGASLGALAMLHTHMRHPAAFDGLLLQSGSFFRQRFDKVESGFPRYRRITRFVGAVHRGVDVVRPIPVSITCGTAEENRANNQAVALALADHGYDVSLRQLRDAHTWTCWRDGFDPALPDLLVAVG